MGIPAPWVRKINAQELPCGKHWTQVCIICTMPTVRGTCAVFGACAVAVLDSCAVLGTCAVFVLGAVAVFVLGAVAVFGACAVAVLKPCGGYACCHVGDA